MRRFSRFPVPGLAIFIIATSLGGTAVWAHSGATGVVKQRMVLMSRVGKSMKTISRMFLGTMTYDAQKLRQAARTIGAHGGEKLTRLFPKGSIQGPSQAVPEIWREWKLFSAYAREMQVYAGALAKAAGNPRSPGRTATNDGSVRVAMSGGGRAIVSATSMYGPAGIMGGERDPGMSPARLARMAPRDVFARVAGNCGACHTRFRRSK